ncbi:MAG: phosphatase PAP2 family protein [Bacilli bacterium]|nr:phosphatase PAP2 family protein [Bacilli bacterium]
MLKTLKRNSFAITCQLIVVIIQLLAYSGTRLINGNMNSYNIAIDIIDNNIPFINWFIIIYIACYPWWYVGPLLVLRYNRKRYYEYLTSAAIGYIIAGIIYIVLPTEIQRPIIENDSFLNMVVNFIYKMDTPANNLFPSLHCFISWNCYLCIRGEKEVPTYYKIGYLIFAVLVCASTVLVKQHFFIDIIAGVVLAELTYYIAKKIKLPNKLINIEKNKIKELV